MLRRRERAIPNHLQGMVDILAKSPISANMASVMASVQIGTGFSEEDLAKHTAFFKEHIIDVPRPYYIYSDDSRIKPDVWFDPVQVWEVKCADLSISPVHKAAIGQVHGGKGISLRFPRFIRIRDDKTPEAATDASQVAEMYNNQAVVGNNNKGLADEDY